MFWEQYSHEPYVAVARFQVRYQGKPVAELEPRLVERGKAALQRLEGRPGGQPFPRRRRLSLADVALVAYTRVAQDGGFDSPTIRGCRPGWPASSRRLKSSD